MTSHTNKYVQLQNFEKGTHKVYPMASVDDDPFDENDEAQERRREERRKRKQNKRRNQLEAVEEGDPEVLLQEPKKNKRRNKQKPQPNDLWYDESLDDELDGVDDDWYDEWDS